MNLTFARVSFFRKSLRNFYSRNWNSLYPKKSAGNWDGWICQKSVRSKITWGKTLKNGRSKFCGRQLLGPFLNTLPSILGSEKKSLTDIGRKRLSEKFGKLLEEKKYFTRNF